MIDLMSSILNLNILNMKESRKVILSMNNIKWTNDSSDT